MQGVAAHGECKTTMKHEQFRATTAARRHMHTVQKRPYSVPHLTSYGGIAKLTAGGSGPTLENGLRCKNQDITQSCRS